MPHKLLIETTDLKYTEKYKEYNEYTTPIEVIRGVPFRCELKITNIGEKEFPGGELSLTINMGEGRRSISISPVKKSKIERIAKEENMICVSPNIMAGAAGIGDIRLKVLAEDGEKVLYARSRDREPTDSWSNPIYSIEREYIEIIRLLKELKK